MANVAALDCGSNSIRLLVADTAGTSFVREMRITRLSQGVDANGALTDDAIERTLDVLRHYRSIMDRYDVDKGLLVATSAVRDASNGGNFLAAAAAITGVQSRCLTGKEEATFTYRGATASLAASTQSTLVVDIGGGSTEMAVMVEGALVSHSMQLGCVRVTERALGADVVTPRRAAAARDLIQREVERAWREQPSFDAVRGDLRLVGVAGTVATLAQLVAGDDEYERDRVHHQSLHRSDVQYWIATLGGLTPSERLALPGMVAGREDVLVSGLMILDAVMERFAVTTLMTSEDDILDGVAAWCATAQ